MLQLLSHLRQDDMHQKNALQRAPPDYVYLAYPIITVNDLFLFQ